MARLLSFDDLWTMAVSSARSHNGLSYHPCCDSWTTKSSKLKRKSHSEKIQWREIISKLDKNDEAKKEAMLAKMKVEGWKLPAIINDICHFQPRLTDEQQIPFKVHIPQHKRTLPPMRFDRENRDLQIDCNTSQLINRFDSRLFGSERQHLCTHIFQIAVWFPSLKSPFNSRTQQNSQAEDFSKLILELPNNISSILFKAINQLHAEKSLVNERLVKGSLRPLTETLNNSVSTLYWFRFHQGRTSKHQG